jgi:hypothetical protein
MIKRSQLVGAAVAAIVVVGGIAAIPGVSAQDRVIQPQQTFRFKTAAFGCVSKDTFDAAQQHAQAGEQGKVQQLFNGFECLSTPETTQFRVLRVVGHDVEFVNAGNHDDQGMWTADRFIKQ